MSTAPSAGATPARSSIRRASRRASGTPRVWIPTSATSSSSGLPSMISWAMRERVRPSPSASRRVLPLYGRVRAHPTPFRPRWTGLKGYVPEATVAAPPDARRSGRRPGSLGRHVGADSGRVPRGHPRRVRDEVGQVLAAPRSPRRAVESSGCLLRLEDGDRREHAVAGVDDPVPLEARLVARSCGANSSTARRAPLGSSTPWYLRMTVCIVPPPVGTRQIRAAMADNTRRVRTLRERPTETGPGARGALEDRAGSTRSRWTARDVEELGTRSHVGATASRLFDGFPSASYGARAPRAERGPLGVRLHDAGPGADRGLVDGDEPLDVAAARAGTTRPLRQGGARSRSTPRTPGAPGASAPPTRSPRGCGEVALVDRGAAIGARPNVLQHAARRERAAPRRARRRVCDARSRIPPTCRESTRARSTSTS